MSEALEFCTQPTSTAAGDRSTPTASLMALFSAAKARAGGAEGRSSLLVVELVDVCSLGMGKIAGQMAYSSFGTSFAMGVGPGGAVVWFSSALGGRGLGEHVARGGDREQTWTEADAWVGDLEKLVRRKVSTVTEQKSRRNPYNILPGACQSKTC